MLETIIQLSINGLLLGGVYALIAIGLSLILGIMQIVNFAHGEFLMISMYVCFWLFHLYGLDPYLSLIIVIPLTFIMGMATQKFIIKPILNAQQLTQIFATVGLSIGMQNAVLLFWKGDYRFVRTEYSTKVINLGQLMFSFPRLMAFLFAISMSIALFVFLKKTSIGKAMRATAQDKEGAMLVGIDISKIYLIAFGLGIVCVGAAGAVLSPIYSVFPRIGIGFSLISFVIVVLGGLGNLIGALVAGLMIGLIESYSGFFLSIHLKEAVYFVVFILILLFKPTGLFGHKTV